MNDNDLERVGYMRPPKHSQFKKGQCGNPFGRAGKGQKVKKVERTDADIIAELEAETVEFQGRRIAMREARLRVLYQRAVKGDLKAMHMLDEKMKGKEKPERRGGVLVLPASQTPQEWEIATAEQQAKFREARPDEKNETDRGNIHARDD